MEIQRTDLRELRALQEDMAEYFCDEFGVSGETYWTCVESIAQVKLMEVKGEIQFDMDDLKNLKKNIQGKIDFCFKKAQKNSGNFLPKYPF